MLLRKHQRLSTEVRTVALKSGLKYKLKTQKPCTMQDLTLKCASPHKYRPGMGSRLQIQGNMSLVRREPWRRSDKIHERKSKPRWTQHVTLGQSHPSRPTRLLSWPCSPKEEWKLWELQSGATRRKTGTKLDETKIKTSRANLKTLGSKNPSRNSILRLHKILETSLKSTSSFAVVKKKYKLI